MSDDSIGSPDPSGAEDGSEANSEASPVGDADESDSERYAALRRAADVYGTTPTALARMLLNRGVAAVLNAYRAEMRIFERVDPKG